MWNQFFEPTDLEDRKGLLAPDAAQIVLTTFLLAGATLLKTYYLGCSDGGSLWIDFMFYGNLIWFIYLMTSLVGQYKNLTIRALFRVRI